MALYELAVLGSPTEPERKSLEETIAAELAEFGFELGKEVVLRSAADLDQRDERSSFAACYFVTPKNDDAELEAAAKVVALNAPLIPTVAFDGSFGDVPPAFSGANGLRRRQEDGALVELAAALLECVGLLRSQRRVFVSYRRNESRTVALQLHDELSGRGFDVFLDTHDIRPGQAFQEVLWHRLCDSDVMVMLDTPGYFNSTWTRQEIGRARAKDIQVLRVVWPGHAPSRQTDLADTKFLDGEDFREGEDQLRQATIDSVCLQVEALRSRSLAARHRLMTGKLAVEVERVGGAMEAVGAHRAVALIMPNGHRLWAYPIIGIPTAESLHDISTKAARGGVEGSPALVYDHIGLRPAWLAHLSWLEQKIVDVRWIRITEAAWTFASVGEVT